MPPDDVFAEIAALPSVADAVDEARVAVDGLRGHRVLRRSAEKVSAESTLRGARASGALEGADLPLDVVRRTVRASGHLPEPEGPVVEGALRVAAEVGLLQETWRRAPLQVLARLHVLAAAGRIPADELGRPTTRGRGPPRVAGVAAVDDPGAGGRRRVQSCMEKSLLRKPFRSVAGSSRERRRGSC